MKLNYNEMIIRIIIKSFAVIIAFALTTFILSGQPESQDTELRVTVVQMDVVDGDLKAKMKRAEKNVRKAARLQADIICLPEAVDYGWLYWQARPNAFTISGRYSDFICRFARELKVWIAVGCLEKEGDKTYNSAIPDDRTGMIVLKHRKINTLSDLTSHLYDSGSAEDIKVVDTEFGVIGITICADNFIIENSKRVAELGAWLLMTPHGCAARVKDVPDNAVRFMTHIRNIA